MESIPEQKRRIRRTIRSELVPFLTPSYCREAVQKIRPRLELIAADCRNILIYLSLADEFPTYPLLWSLYLGGKTPRNILIPWCDGENLRLFPLLSAKSADPFQEAERFGERLCRGAFGIPEPLPKLRELPEFQFDPTELDFILVPGRGFDRQMNRLGRGKGFYDRFFTEISPNCRLCGIAFDQQIRDVIPVEPHDRKLDLIITENQTILSK